MEDIQQSELIFYLPIVLAYAVACGVGWLGFRKWQLMPAQEIPSPQKPWHEFLWALLAIVGVLAIGRVYAAGYLIPSRYNPWAWILNNFIIYSPIFIALALRKQSTETLWLSGRDLPKKLAIGAGASILAVAVFLILRSEGPRYAAVVEKAFSVAGLSSFVAVFLEGVALAFLFVRLTWISNLKIALAIPALLFAAAHIPGMLAEQDPWWHIALMSLVTGSITVFVLYTCHRTRDIIWIGLVHYFLDAAIGAY